MISRTLFFPLALAATAAACSADPRSPVPLDCHVGDAYDFRVVESYEANSTTALPHWYSYGDPTPDAAHTLQVGDGIAPESIPGGRCGSQSALVLRSQGHNDYGSGFGTYHFGGWDVPSPIDATGYEGLSFWARSGVESDKGATIALDDKTSFQQLIDPAGDASPDNVTCIKPDTEAGTAIYYTDPNGNVVSSSLEILPNQCGNSFRAVLLTTTEWKLYLLPFESFKQLAQPNRVPTGIDRASIVGVTLPFPTEARVELWIDDLGFYRHKAD